MNVYSRLFVAWWAQVDSNHRPHAYQACALTTWAMSPFSLLRCLSSTLALDFRRWWRWWESNPWPPACRAGALPAELHPHTWGMKFKGKSEELMAFATPLSLYYPVTFRSLKIEQQQTRTRFFASPLFSPSVKSIFFCFGFCLLLNSERSVTPLLSLTFSIERRWSSRTFRYGYLVTT